MRLYVEYSWTLMLFFKGFKFAYKTTKFYAKWLMRNLDKNTNFNILKNLLRKVRISNLLCSITV